MYVLVYFYQLYVCQIKLDYTKANLKRGILSASALKRKHKNGNF